MEQSMFGADPWTVRQQLEDKFLANNSNMDLGAMATRAGYSLGTGLAGLAGFEHPQIREAKAVQEAVDEVRKSGVSMTDPAAYYRKMAGVFGAKGLTKQAEAAAMKALEFEDKKEERDFKTKDRSMQLEIKQEELAIKSAQLKRELEKAKDLPGFAQFQALIKDAFASGQADQESIAEAIIEFNATKGNIEAALRKIKNKKEKAPEQWGEPVTRNINGKVVQQQQNLVTKEWKTLAGNEANISNTTHVSPNLKEFTGEHNIMSQGLSDTKKVREQLSAIRSAMSVNEKDNPTAQNAADVLIAKAIQPGGMLSNQDINRTLGAGDFATRVADKVSRFANGIPTKFTQVERAALLKLMEKSLVKEHNQIQALPRKAASRAGYNPDEFFQIEAETPEASSSGLSPQTQELLKRYPPKGK